MKQMCSLLAHYSDFLAHMDFLPIFIRPFVEFLGKKASKIQLFEIILTYIHNFIKNFLISPSKEQGLIEINHIPFLKKLMNCLRYHDNELYQAFLDENINLMEVLLPIIKCSFQNLLFEQDWLNLMDFLFIHHDKSELLIFFIVSFLKYFRTSFLNAPNKQTMLLFFDKINPCNMRKILENTLKINNYSKNYSCDTQEKSKSCITILKQEAGPKNDKIKYLELGGKMDDIRLKIAKEQNEFYELKKKEIKSHFEREKMIKEEEAKRLELEAAVKILKNEKNLFSYKNPAGNIMITNKGVSDENDLKNVSEINRLQKNILDSIKASREIKELEIENERQKWEEFKKEKEKEEVYYNFMNYFLQFE
jgi:hypothetical protein